MSSPRRRIGERLGLGMGTLAALAVVVLMVSGLSAAAGNPVSATSASGPLRMSENMPAFYDGRIVQTVYEQGYFVGSNATYNSSYGPQPLQNQSAIGVNPQVFPSPQDHGATLWVLVPWWGPSSAPYAPAYNPAAYGIKEHCAPANVQICFDHPATIFVPGLGVVPLPGHDHLINFLAHGDDIWWNVAVDLILNPSAWPTSTSHGWTGITSLAALNAAQKAGTSSHDLPTNVFLNFRTVVDQKVGSTSPSGSLLQSLETMPSFLSGRVVQTVYEQGYYVGTNVSHNSSYGSQPLFGNAAVGTNPTTYPAAKSSIKPFYVLVPWWGPSATPYAPAYDPSAYGIQLDCAPATVQVCWDHPATIVVPGLGNVPLPGHDHLIGTNADHKDIWWNVVVVLVTNASAWPMISVFGESGIVSVAALHNAQTLGEASAGLPTNVFLNFYVQ
ncbi:MAG: hypothetical protein L3K02_01280 [Thermoplasmata archaeon]|nr:hypothetical protein [Thermoplasmata archaeon]